MQEIINEYLQKKALKHQEERKKSHGTMFTASNAGLCVGRSFHHLNETEQTLPDDEALMMMKLGDLVHNIIQDASWRRDPGDAMIEYFLKNEKLNVCGSLDLYIKSEKHLIDIKSVKYWDYQQKFSKINKDKPPSEHHAFQLGTYAMMLQAANFPVEKMSILYVSRNDGRIGEKEVSLKFIKYAEDYWITVNEEMEYGPSGFDSHHMLPVHAWECKYCSFANNCEWKLESVVLKKGRTNAKK